MNPPVFVPPAAPSPLRLDPGPRGHRYGLDAFLLADFAEVSGESLVADLGTGTGVVALLMAYRRPGLRVVGVELQGEFLRVAAANARRSRLVGSIAFVQADLRRTAAWAKGGRFDAVVVNPPYHKLGTGRLSPDPGRAMARCEVALDVPTWLGAARHLLSAGGRLFVVFLAERESELVSRMKEKGLPARRLRRVHPAAGRPATTV
ncbi:MAG: tRNA1(Val) (adenine(37)-N6)-methyltransferase, partial [Nitrospinota bacterium]